MTQKPKYKKHVNCWGGRLAWSAEHATPDLRVVGSSSTLGLDYLKIKS